MRCLSDPVTVCRIICLEGHCAENRMCEKAGKGRRGERTGGRETISEVPVRRKLRARKPALLQLDRLPRKAVPWRIDHQGGICRVQIPFSA